MRDPHPQVQIGGGTWTPEPTRSVGNRAQCAWSSEAQGPHPLLHGAQEEQIRPNSGLYGRAFCTL